MGLCKITFKYYCRKPEYSSLLIEKNTEEEQGWLRMEKIDMDYKQQTWKILATFYNREIALGQKKLILYSVKVDLIFSLTELTVI